MEWLMEILLVSITSFLAYLVSLLYISFTDALSFGTGGHMS